MGVRSCVYSLITVLKEVCSDIDSLFLSLSCHGDVHILPLRSRWQSCIAPLTCVYVRCVESRALDPLRALV